MSDQAELFERAPAPAAAMAGAEADAPLATRMRPRTFDEFVGQEAAVGESSVLRRALARGDVPSMILWGPPGSGKTTLAHIIAAGANAVFEPVSATSAGVADLRRVVERARERARAGRRTVLFIDEIHRFNKGQQDAVLPHVESGLVTLLGATTENPSFEDSDPDASVYWLARMLEAGEDPLFIARRMVILAAEDVGLADPRALTIAVAAQQAAHFVGMPEGYLPLAEATLYLATAPKSNSAMRAYVAARGDVADTLHQPVPLHLRTAVTALDRRMGFGSGYRYAHDEPDAVVDQAHLPEELAGRRYYEPGRQGAEAEIADRVEAVRQEIERRRAGS